jgi:hypothetical protein
MKLPQNMAQVVSDVESVRDYTIILPLGTYTSGTYTIPNGRTWDDFKIIIGVLGRTSSVMSSATLLDEQFTSTAWAAELNPDYDSVNSSSIEWASATTFSISRSGQGAIRMLLGYLK